MAQPLLSHVEGNVGDDRFDAEAVAQSLGRGVKTRDTGGAHDLAHIPPSRRAGPRPQIDAASGIRAVADGFQIVDGFERDKERRRNRDRPVDSFAALLEALDDEDPILEIDPVGSQRQCLGYAAARMGKRAAEGADLMEGGFRCVDEVLAFGGVRYLRWPLVS